MYSPGPLDLKALRILRSFPPMHVHSRLLRQCTDGPIGGLWDSAVSNWGRDYFISVALGRSLSLSQLTVLGTPFKKRDGIGPLRTSGVECMLPPRAQTKHDQAELANSGDGTCLAQNYSR
jgi:hypothetical protein